MECGFNDTDIVSRAVALDCFERGRGQSEILGPDDIGCDLAIFQFNDCGFTADCDFIGAVAAMNDQGMLDTDRLERFSDKRHDRRIVDADDMALGRRWVGERAKDIEQCADPELAPDRGGKAHGWVEGRREHEAEAIGFDARLDLGRAQGDVEPQLFIKVGTAGFAGNRAVAVLGDLGPGCCGNEGCRRTDIDCAGLVAAGTDWIDQEIDCWMDADREIAHRTGGPGDFRNRFALDTQAR